MNRLFVLKLVASVAVSLLFVGGVVADDSAVTATPSQPMIGEQAPAFSLMDLNDKKFSSDDLRGSYLVIHFATSW